MNSNLSDIDSLKEDMSAFIQKLRINEIDYFISNRLEELLESLDDGSIFWIQADLYDVFNPSMLVEQVRSAYLGKSEWLGTVELFRNVLVLLPIAITWFALSKAARTYFMVGQSDSTGSIMNTPFLFQWEQGFGGQIPHIFGVSLTFSHVAIFDAFLIAIIIGLSAVVHWKSNWIAEKVDQEAVKLGVELDSILWRLNKVFYEDKFINKGDAEQRSIIILNSINEFVDDFQSQGEELNNLLSAEIERLDIITENHKAETKIFKTVSKYFQDSYKQLEIFSTEVSNIHEDQNQILRSLLAVEGQFGSFDEVVSEFGRSLEKSTNELTSMFETYSDKLEDFSLFVNQLHEDLEAISKNYQRDSKNNLQQINKVIEEFSSTMGSISNDISNVSKEVIRLVDETIKMSKSLTAPSSPSAIIDQPKSLRDRIKSIMG